MEGKREAGRPSEDPGLEGNRDAKEKIDPLQPIQTQGWRRPAAPEVRAGCGSRAPVRSGSPGPGHCGLQRGFGGRRSSSGTLTGSLPPEQQALHPDPCWLLVERGEANRKLQVPAFQAGLGLAWRCPCVVWGARVCEGVCAPCMCDWQACSRAAVRRRLRTRASVLVCAHT